MTYDREERHQLIREIASIRKGLKDMPETAAVKHNAGPHECKYEERWERVLTRIEKMAELSRDFVNAMESWKTMTPIMSDVAMRTAILETKVTALQNGGNRSNEWARALTVAAIATAVSIIVVLMKP